MLIHRRTFLGAALAATDIDDRSIGPLRTPHKFNKLVLSATGIKGDFDEKAVDDPIVFFANGQFQMLYIGWDGTGYQTGLATSTDLVTWKRARCVGPRDPASKWTKYNLALSSILRDKGLKSRGDARKINGRYLGAWHAYPNPGYEEGAAVIGLAWSDDLVRWQLTEPILLPQDGASWEHGGLYRPDLLEERGTYYLYYNAKTDTCRKKKAADGVSRPALRPRATCRHGRAMPEIRFSEMATATVPMGVSPRIPTSCAKARRGPCTTSALDTRGPARRST